MAVVLTPEVSRLFAEKKELQRLMAEQNEKMGVVPDPTATAEKSRASMLADGVRPEDNILSRGIIEMREE